MCVVVNETSCCVLRVLVIGYIVCVIVNETSCCVLRVLVVGSIVCVIVDETQHDSLRRDAQRHVVSVRPALHPAISKTPVDTSQWILERSLFPYHDVTHLHGRDQLGFSS